MKLQTREVRLLALLIVVGVLALFAQYLILPELKKGDAAQEANSNLLFAIAGPGFMPPPGAPRP